MADEVVETGFDKLPQGAVEPTAPKITDAEKRAAEMAEGARQSAAAADLPQVPHPAVLAAQAERELLDKALGESEAARMNRELFERIKAARHQPAPQPPPTQPVTPLMAERTRLEIEAGRKASQRHADQQAGAVRRLPSAAEIAAQGKTTAVFNPDVVIPKEVFPASPRLPGQTSTNDQTRGVQSL